MIRQMMRLAVDALLVELEHWRNPTPAGAPAPVATEHPLKAVRTPDLSRAKQVPPWEMVQEVSTTKAPRRRKARAS